MLLEPFDTSLSFRGLVPRTARSLLTYLGTAGFVLEAAGRTIVLDPFVTRPGVLTTALRRLVPDLEAIRRWLPRADDVLAGQAHHDHVLDAPDLCRQTGARLIGSRAVCNVGRAAGMHETQLVETAGGETLPSGSLSVRGLPSRHGKVFPGRVALPGVIPQPPSWPPRVRELRHGLVLNWVVRAPGATIVHIDSADFIDNELAGIPCDVLCLCVIGRAYRPHYVAAAVSLLRPRFVIACHWDWLLTPLDRPARMLPAVDLPGFVREVRAAGAEPVVLPFFGRFAI